MDRRRKIEKEFLADENFTRLPQKEKRDCYITLFEKTKPQLYSLANIFADVVSGGMRCGGLRSWIRDKNVSLFCLIAP